MVQKKDKENVMELLMEVEVSVTVEVLVNFIVSAMRGSLSINGSSSTSSIMELSIKDLKEEWKQCTCIEIFRSHLM